MVHCKNDGNFWFSIAYSGTPYLKPQPTYTLSTTQASPQLPDSTHEEKNLLTIMIA
jgi:hypothetical protein